MPKKTNYKKRYPSLDNLKDNEKEKQKWIKYFLRLVKKEYPKTKFIDIVNKIIKEDDPDFHPKTACHKRIHDEGFLPDDSKMWAFCQKLFLLIKTNPKTAKKIAKEMDIVKEMKEILKLKELIIDGKDKTEA